MEIKDTSPTIELEIKEYKLLSPTLQMAESIEDKSPTLRIVEPDAPGEEWKSSATLGYPQYEVSTLGNVRNISTKLTLLGRRMKTGYIRYTLYNNGDSKEYLGHILVALIFIPNDNPLRNTVNHKNHDRSDNNVINLEWFTTLEQRAHQRQTKTHIGRPIFQLDLDGNIIRRWDKMTDASRATGLNLDAIWQALKKNKMKGGFHWSYCDSYPIPGEIWRSVPYTNIEPLEASNLGRIRKANGLIGSGISDNGYLESVFAIRKVNHEESGSTTS